MTWTTLNPADFSGGALSGGNLVFTSNNASVGGYARAVDGQSSGKYYFELPNTGPINGGYIAQLAGGICEGSATLTQINSRLLGAYMDSALSGNSVIINGTTEFSVSLGIGNVQIGIAVDLDAGLIWLRPISSAVWNNSATANPATGIGGFALGAAAGTMFYPVVTIATSDGVVFTCNFGQNAFTGAVPAGFMPGWPGVFTPVPSGLAETAATTTSITMGWTAAGGVDPVTSYTLQYRLTGTTSWTQITGLTTTSCTVPGLASGTTYDFQVEAISAAGPSGFSATAEGATLFLPAQPPIFPQSLGRYRGNCGINWFGRVLIGDAFSGVIGAANFQSFTEYGFLMQGLVTAPPIHKDRKRIFLPRFELDVESGVGLVTGQGSDPVWMMDYSKDGGRTWSTVQKWRSMGQLGAYTKRLRWLRNGQARQWLIRIRSTDPVRRVIIGAYADIVVGLG